MSAGVSGPTILRLVAKLGFASYPRFQQALRDELEQRLQPPLAKVPARQRVARTDPDFVNRYGRAIIANIERSLGEVPRSEFKGALDLLLEEVDEKIGLDRLRALHVNDSKTPLGSNRDRHDNIGDGLMGEELGVFLSHPSLQELPAVLETPGKDGHGPDRREMKRLRDLHADHGGEAFADVVAREVLFHILE